MPTTATSSTVEIHGYALRHIRKLMNLTPRTLAEEIGRDRTYIVKIEHGHPRVSTEVFDALVKALAIEDDRALRAAPHEPAA
jgi:transcriptional regulator with XRE-family HTH domain